MGKLVDGEWTTQWYDTKDSGGSFERAEAVYRNWITPDGDPRSGAIGGFTPEAGRYHLYVSYACPWAHRCLIFRELKGLSDLIGVSVVNPGMFDDGWTFEIDDHGATGDLQFGHQYLYQLYQQATPGVTTRVTVPVLWDTQTNQIVSNESSEIIRMFNSAFDSLTGNNLDFWPLAMRDAIEAVNSGIYDAINNGVYRAGFATTQSAYDGAVQALFEKLEEMETRLASNRYLMGDTITEADWRLFTTLARFDLVYHLHFKCNRKRLIDFPNLWGFTRELYQWHGVAQTTNFEHIVRHYHTSHESINPHRIIPINPDLHWNAPHGRG